MKNWCVELSRSENQTFPTTLYSLDTHIFEGLPIDKTMNTTAKSITFHGLMVLYG
jgi:hypothetical protein